MSIIIEKQTISKSHETEEAKDYGLIIREVGLTGLLAASELDLLDETDYGFEPRHRLDDPESAKKIMQELCRDVSDNKKRPIIKAEFSRKMRKLTGLNGSNGSNNMISLKKGIRSLSTVSQFRDDIREAREREEGKEYIRKLSAEANLLESVLYVNEAVQDKSRGNKEVEIFIDLQEKLYKYILTHPDLGYKQLKATLDALPQHNATKKELDASLRGAIGEAAFHRLVKDDYRRASQEEDKRGIDFVNNDPNVNFPEVNIKCPRGEVDRFGKPVKFGFFDDRDILVCSIPFRYISPESLEIEEAPANHLRGVLNNAQYGDNRPTLDAWKKAR